MKITLDKNDKIWETISVLLLLTNALLIAFTLPSLPDNVAFHFNFAGQADSWGSKYIFWLLFGLSLFIYALLTFISFRPGLYESRMTKNNIEEQYKLTSKMARTIKAFLLLLFIVLFSFMFKSAQGKLTRQFPYLITISLGLILLPTLYYVVKILKVR